MAQKPSIPKGTRDFTPEKASRRNYIFSTISAVFQQFGYSPIETPAMENLSTLLGKYGAEGDKLLFKILNSGDYLQKANPDALEQRDSNKLITSIADKGLRYDLTVPFARFVVMNQQELTFPFKRYQIQPVWRADNPQAGRYREFYQCDVDVIGSNSLLNELELLQIIDTVFSRLQLNVLIKLNNRKILAGIAELIGQPEKIIDITVAIDKLDKIGIEKVIAELLQNGIPEESVEKLKPILQLEGSNEEKIQSLQHILADSPIGMKGVEEIAQVFHLTSLVPFQCKLELDLTLARGLNYYTGAIMEVKSTEFAIGSICGGGRYDDLTGIFGLPNMSGVGVSFGADRIYDVLNGLNRFPENQLIGPEFLVLNFGNEDEIYGLQVLNQLRQMGLSAEMYPDASKLKKQMAYADKRRIPYVIFTGEEERKSGSISLKSMADGSQKTLKIEELGI
ncbi:MAG: histidine--tRNA ligase [Bacteroidales bacterium]|nr:histidine--tRNA ligase [Bacteroidales bacterium]